VGKRHKVEVGEQHSLECLNTLTTDRS